MGVNKLQYIFNCFRKSKFNMEKWQQNKSSSISSSHNNRNESSEKFVLKDFLLGPWRDTWGIEREGETLSHTGKTITKPKDKRKFQQWQHKQTTAIAVARNQTIRSLFCSSPHCGPSREGHCGIWFSKKWELMMYTKVKEISTQNHILFTL